MITKISTAIIIGVMFFFISLISIKNKTFYYDLMEVPKIVYTDKTTALKSELNRISKYYGQNRSYYGYDSVKLELSKYRVDKTYNYLISSVCLVGGSALGFIILGLFDKKLQ